jgi:hypothetical protein
MLDVTRGGTVIVRSPFAADTGEIRVIEETELDVDSLEPPEPDLEGEPTREWTSDDLAVFFAPRELDDERPAPVSGEIERRDSVEIELDLDDIVEEIAGHASPRWLEITQVTAGRVDPRPYWDAPEPGQTIRRRNPLLRTTRYSTVR